MANYTVLRAIRAESPNIDNGTVGNRKHRSSYRASMLCYLRLVTPARVTLVRVD